MREYKISDICKIHGGIPAPKDEIAFSQSGIPFVRMRDLGRYHLTINLDKTDNTLSKEFVVENTIKIAPKGAIIMPRSGSVALNHRAILAQDSVIVSHICALEMTSFDVDNRFLYYILNVIDMRTIAKKTTGLDAITFKDLGNIKINAPDIQTQRQIVAALDKANSLIDKRQKSIELLDDLLRSTFLEMFGDPYRNEKKWDLGIVEDVVERIQSGWSVAGEQRCKENDEYGVLKVSAVTSGRYKPQEHKAVGRTNISKRLVVPEKGDVLFSRANTMDLVAATCIVDEYDEKIFLPDKLWKIHLKEKCTTPEFFVSVLQSPSYRKNLALRSTGSSGSMLNISQKKLLSYQFPKPPYQKQLEFSEIHRRFEYHRIKLVEYLSVVETLFQSLLQRAFHGDLSFDLELQLDAYLENQDYESISEDGLLIQELVDRFNQHNQQRDESNEDEVPFKFESLEEYERAKKILFDLLKEEKVVQQYDQEKKQTVLNMP